MKDVQITVKEQAQMEKKIERFRKRISLKHWIGWSGGYGRSKKK